MTSDPTHARLRMRLAFWRAQDRRSVAEGPEWLWRGPCLAPLRRADLTAATAAVIERRAAVGVPPEMLFEQAGPRRRRLPRWAAARTAARWGAGAAGAAAVAVIATTTAGDRIGIGPVAAGAAVAAAAIATLVTAVLAWARRDPLALTPAQAREVGAARRELNWNPLAGTGPVGSAAAYLMEGIEVCRRLQASSGWGLPAAERLRWLIDPNEEVFQIARAAHALECCMGATSPLAPDKQQWQLLEEALLQRLSVLYRCVENLDELVESDRRATATSTANEDQRWMALATAIVENELAAGPLAAVSADLHAAGDAYRSLPLQ